MTLASTLFLRAALVLTHAAPFTPPPQPATPQPSAWRGDARFLLAAIDSIHPRPYAYHSRAAWDSAVARLEERLPALRYAQAIAELSRLLALLGDGHSRLGHLELAAHARPTLQPLPGPGLDSSYPFECRVFADGLWIVRATAAHADLPGARVVEIGGRPVADAVEALRPFIPADNAMWSLHVLPAFLRSPGYMSAAGLTAGAEAPLGLTVVGRDGRRRDVTLFPTRQDSAARWISADSHVMLPLPLSRALPDPFGWADLSDSARTVFVRLRQIADARGGETLARFVERLFAHVDSLGARRLILDLRGNGGGDNYLNQPLVHAVLRRPALDRPGGTFVIVDRGTFSAAVSLAVELERETHALFVGEPTGGAPNSPGDPTRVTLPASGLVVRISTLLWQGSDPRDRRPFIAPDLPVMESWADWLGRRDPALAAIQSYAPRAASDAPPNTRWGSPWQAAARPPAIRW